MPQEASPEVGHLVRHGNAIAESVFDLQRKDHYSADDLRAGRHRLDRPFHVCQLADGVAITYGGVLGGVHDHGARVGRIGRGMRHVRCAYATRGKHLFIAFVLSKLLSPGFQTNQNYFF